MTLHVEQESKYQGNDWWRWSVWLKGSTAEMAEIDTVIYTLHPTFPNPVETVTDRKSGFRLDSSGWGEFELYLAVHSKNGKVRKLKHWLELPYPDTPGGAGSPRGPARGGVSDKVPRTAFMSAGAANAQLERRIREVLSNRGFRVVTRDDVAPGVPIEAGVDSLMNGAEAAIFLLSGTPSLTIKKEIARAKANSIPHLVPVVVGPPMKLPLEFKGVRTVTINDKMTPDLVADQIFPPAKL